MKWAERIGAWLVVIGMVLVLFAGARFSQGTATELTNRLGIAGLVLALCGVLLVNLKSEWLFRE